MNTTETGTERQLQSADTTEITSLIAPVVEAFKNYRAARETLDTIKLAIQSVDETRLPNVEFIARTGVWPKAQKRQPDDLEVYSQKTDKQFSLYQAIRKKALSECPPDQLLTLTRAIETMEDQTEEMVSETVPATNIYDLTRTRFDQMETGTLAEEIERMQTLITESGGRSETEIEIIEIMLKAAQDVFKNRKNT